MIVLNKLKKYSFILWIAAAIIIFVGANKIYRDYAAKEIVEESFGGKPGDIKNNEGKPEENAKGNPLVPDFTLKNEKGEEVSLSDYSGKVVILNFWASWCPPCKAEMPEFKEMNNELKASKNVVLLTINLTDGQRETKEKAVKFLKDNKYDFTVLFDEEGIAAGIFGIQSIPTTAIIDKEGYLHDYIMGATTKHTVLKSVEEVK
jgi:cytochrome c biogenesis protein CcmG, thiol:disulfide interchange protein DsbE